MQSQFLLMKEDFRYVMDGQISLQKQENRQQRIQRRVNNFTKVLALIISLRRQYHDLPAESFWRSSYWISLMSLQTCCNLWKRNKHRNTYKKNHDKKMLLHAALLHESLKKKKKIPGRTEVGDLKETVVFTEDSKLLLAPILEQRVSCTSSWH